MALFVVATPIGNAGDFTLRGLEALRTADLVIGEELKVLRQILKSAGVQARATDQLNEHSDADDIKHFVEECRTKNVALVSDCGTPGFCDPGADLVAACRREGVAVHGLPGASSLMALLSVSGERVDQFVFYGFLPAKTELRAGAWRELVKEKRAVIVMETPYRAAKLIEELATNFAGRTCVVGLNLTQEKERVIKARGADLAKHGPYEDAEPVVMILP